jgi:hypothetical protein
MRRQNNYINTVLRRLQHLLRIGRFRNFEDEGGRWKALWRFAWCSASANPTRDAEACLRPVR